MPQHWSTCAPLGAGSSWVQPGQFYGLNATLTPCIFAPTPDQVMHVMAQGQHELGPSWAQVGSHSAQLGPTTAKFDPSGLLVGPSRPLLSSPILWVRAVLVAKRLQFFLPTEGSQPEGRLEHVGPPTANGFGLSFLSQSQDPGEIKRNTSTNASKCFKESRRKYTRNIGIFYIYILICKYVYA